MRKKILVLLAKLKEAQADEEFGGEFCLECEELVGHDKFLECEEAGHLILSGDPFDDLSYVIDVLERLLRKYK